MSLTWTTVIKDFEVPSKMRAKMAVPVDPHWLASRKGQEKLHDLVQLEQLKEGIKFGGS